MPTSLTGTMSAAANCSLPNETNLTASQLTRECDALRCKIASSKGELVVGDSNSFGERNAVRPQCPNVAIARDGQQPVAVKPAARPDRSKEGQARRRGSSGGAIGGLESLTSANPHQTRHTVDTLSVELSQADRRSQELHQPPRCREPYRLLLGSRQAPISDGELCARWPQTCAIPCWLSSRRDRRCDRAGVGRSVPAAWSYKLGNSPPTRRNKGLNPRRRPQDPPAVSVRGQGAVGVEGSR